MGEPIGRRLWLYQSRSGLPPGQSRKQWLTRWKVAKAVLDALLTNLSVSPVCCASAHVMYGYNSSAAEATLRMFSVLSLQAVTVCWADLGSDNQTAGHNDRVAKICDP